MPNIIIIRPPQDATDTAKNLEKISFESFIEPVMEVELLTPILPEIEGSIIITSRNAIRALISIIPKHEAGKIKLICVGRDTTLFARENGFTKAEYAGQNAIELCEYIKSNYFGKKFIYAAGEYITQELTQANCGADITKIIAYKTTERKKFSAEFIEKLIAGNFAGVLFFSSNSAEIFCKLLKESGLEKYSKNLNAFCLSENIAKNIASYGFKATMFANNADIDTIIELIRKFKFE